MAVYVDDPVRHAGTRLCCHLVADTPQELQRMARELKLDPAWIQHAGAATEHYDLTRGKREEAIKRGAVPVSRRQLADWLTKRRQERAQDDHRPKEHGTLPAGRH